MFSSQNIYYRTSIANSCTESQPLSSCNAHAYSCTCIVCILEGILCLFTPCTLYSSTILLSWLWNCFLLVQKKTKKDSSSQHKAVSKTTSTASVGASPTKSPEGRDSPKSSGESPSDTPTSDRKVVESKRRSKKARGPKEEGEKKGGFFSRYSLNL